MSKSWRKATDNKRYNDDWNAYSDAEKSYRKHKSEKRINAALHSKDVDYLIQTGEEEDS